MHPTPGEDILSRDNIQLCQRLSFKKQVFERRCQCDRGAQRENLATVIDTCGKNVRDDRAGAIYNDGCQRRGGFLPSATEKKAKPVAPAPRESRAPSSRASAVISPYVPTAAVTVVR